MWMATETFDPTCCSSALSLTTPAQTYRLTPTTPAYRLTAIRTDSSKRRGGRNDLTERRQREQEAYRTDGHKTTQRAARHTRRDRLQKLRTQPFFGTHWLMAKGAQEQVHNITGREFSGDHWLMGKGAQEQPHNTTEGEQIRAYTGYGLGKGIRVHTGYG